MWGYVKVHWYRFRLQIINVKTSKSPHAMKNEENGHLAVREMRKIPGDY
jgi:hypothetical protein